MSKTLNSPLKEFSEANTNPPILSGDPPSDLGALVGSLDSKLSQLPSLCKEFLSVQAEMLVYSKILAQFDSKQHEAQFDGRSAEGLVLHSTPIVINRTRMDYYDADSQKIHLCPSDTAQYPLTVPVEDTLCHEMTHAIDDVYDDRRSGDRVLSILKSPNSFGSPANEFQKDVLLAAASIIDPDPAGAFVQLYCNPSIKGGQSVSEACESAEQKTTKLTKQEKAAPNLTIEYTSFAIENIFGEIKKTLANAGAVSSPNLAFVDRYNKILQNPSSSRASAAASISPVQSEINERAQEVVSVALYEVINHMVTHIDRTVPIATVSSSLSPSSPSAASPSISSGSASTTPALSADRSILRGMLDGLRTTIQPALARVSTRGVASASSSLSSSPHVSAPSASLSLSSSSSPASSVPASSAQQPLAPIAGQATKKRKNTVPAATPRKSTAADGGFAAVFEGACCHSITHGQSASLDSVISDLPLDASRHGARALSQPPPIPNIASSKSRTQQRRHSI